MKRILSLALVIATTATFANAAQAQVTGEQIVGMRINDHGQLVTSPSTMTRDQVAAERLRPQAAAMRIDDQGRLVTAPSTKTRPEVQAELAAAIRTGDMLALGESGATLRQLHPHWFAKTGNAVARDFEVAAGTPRR